MVNCKGCQQRQLTDKPDAHTHMPHTHLFAHIHPSIRQLFIIYSSLLSLCSRLNYERPTPHLFFNRYQHPFGHTSGASEIIPIYRLVGGGETSPWAEPSCESPPVVIFRRIDVRAEIRTQNPVLSNTRLAKMVPLSNLRREQASVGGGSNGRSVQICETNLFAASILPKA
jgi:hypothetical protein